MSSSRSRLRNSLATATPYLALTCFGIAAAPVFAQDAGTQGAAEQESATRLGGVTVTDTAIDEGFKQEKISSPKYTQPLQDTPQTIQIINRDLFQQQGATTLTEALRNSPGVGTFYAGENGNTTTGDAIYMRGFDTSNSIFVDGVRDIGSISRDVFNTEQVEVLKGPAGTDNGSTAPTGAINMVSKQARTDDFISGIVSFGVDGQKRGTADVNHAFDALGGAALRLNLLVQNSDVPGRDHVKNDRIGIAPSLGIGLEGSTRAWLNLLYVEQDNVPDGYVPTIGLPGWEPQAGLEPLEGHPVDPENFYGTRRDHDDVTAKMATLRVEHDFSPSLRLTNITRYGKTKQDYLLTAFMSTGGNITVGSPIEDSTMTRGNLTLKDITNRIFANQLTLNADFNTGSIGHNLVVGAEYTSEKQVSYGQANTGGTPAPANLYNPDWNAPSTYHAERTGALSRGETDTISFYAFDTAKLFDEKLLITGGVRFDHYDTDFFENAVCNNGTGRGAVACGGAPVGTIVTTADENESDWLFNWKLGAVFKPVDPVSLYVNYAVSKQPPGRENFQLSDRNLDPQEAETIEAGIKWNVFGDSLLLSAAVFETTVKNELNRDVLDDAGNPTQTGEKRVKGVELSAVGNITEAWSISAGYSHLDTKVTEGPSMASDGSLELTYIPGDAATLWTNYRLPFGLEIGGGVRHVGGLHRGTDGAAGTPTFTEDYTVVDALLAYPVTENIKLRVNAYNLFDEEYVQSINKSGYRYSPGTPQTFLFSADFRF